MLLNYPRYAPEEKGKEVQFVAKKLGNFKKGNKNPKGIVTLEKPTRKVVLSFKGGFKV